MQENRMLATMWRAAAAGALATATMDAAIVAAGKIGGDAFSSERLDPEMIGRWAYGLMRGRCRHEDVTREAPIHAELALGLATHYATGIVLTEAFLLMPGRPTLARAAGYGIATSALPLLVLFPSLGYGPFGVRSGEAATLIRTMFVGHLAFGAGIGIWSRLLVGG